MLDSTTHIVVVAVGDCEFNSEIKIECECLEAAEEIAIPLNNFGKNVVDVEILTVATAEGKK